jgi:hypothetical protein
MLDKIEGLVDIYNGKEKNKRRFINENLICGKIDDKRGGNKGI